MGNSFNQTVETIIPTILSFIPDLKDKWDLYYKEHYLSVISGEEPYYNERLYVVDLDRVALMVQEISTHDISIYHHVFLACENLLEYGNDEVKDHIFLFIESLLKKMSPIERSNIPFDVRPFVKRIILNILKYWRMKEHSFLKEKAEKYAELEQEYEERTGKKYPFPVYDPNNLE